MRLIDADALIHELNNSHYPGAPYIDAGISIAIGKVCDAQTILDWQIINSIKDVSAKNVEFKNITFECETITDASGNLFEKREKGYWIPCSERLPETHAVDVIEVNGEKHVGFRLSKPVLGYAPGMDDEVEIATVWCEEGLDGSTSWITAPDCERVNVIAWMPLPEPYQGGGNDEID